MKQQSADSHVAPLGHMILIPSQPIFAFSPPGEHANIYTTDADNNWLKSHQSFIWVVQLSSKIYMHVVFWELHFEPLNNCKRIVVMYNKIWQFLNIIY
jgi:hypothetical protein